MTMAMEWVSMKGGEGDGVMGIKAIINMVIRGCAVRRHGEERTKSAAACFRLPAGV